MLRWACIIPAALGGVVLVPKLDPHTPQGLEAALTRTKGAIGELNSLRDTLLGGESSAIARALAVTEAPLAPPRESADILDRLRSDVARLLEREDALPFAPKTDGAVVVPITSGLDDALRRELSNGSARARLEPDGYSADPLREGMARFLANDPRAALEALERAPQDVRASYWIARCREALGEYEQARADYTALAADGNGGELAERAALDLSIVSWKANAAAGGKP